MRKPIKGLIILIFILVITSCGMLSDDKFIYLGHGEDTPDYQLYYDKTRKLFVLIDKRNGCFEKDDTGTCLAFTLKETRNFREKVLAKMIEVDLRLAKDAYGNYAVKELAKAGITTVNKPISVGEVYATPVRQIVLDRKQQYHLVREKYKVDANLVAIVSNMNGKKQIKVAYTIDVPGINKRYGADLRPYIVDPEYLYTHMTMDSVHEAQFMQRRVLNKQQDVKKEVDKYLKGVVDKGAKIEKPKEDIAHQIADLSDLTTTTDQSDQTQQAQSSSGTSSEAKTPVVKTQSTQNN